MKYDYIYDSPSGYPRDYKMNGLDPIYVLFELLDLYLYADSDGNGIIYDLGGNEVHRVKAEVKDERFFDITCSGNEERIKITFSVMEEKDHYPHCDGEYDRYSYVLKEEINFTYELGNSINSNGCI